MKNIKIKKCPECGKTSEKEGNPYWPFCSKRCQTIDLANWATERYRVAGKKVEGEVSEDTPHPDPLPRGEG